MDNRVKFILCVGLCLAVGSIGGYATAPGLPVWYASLTKPIFSPPSWLFGPVWTGLYFLMGVSLYRFLQSSKIKQRNEGLRWFFLQLILNLFWSVLFFLFRLPLLAALEILFLGAAIILTWRSFRKADQMSAVLLLPYLGWVAFASVLNWSIAILNP